MREYVNCSFLGGNKKVLLSDHDDGHQSVHEGQEKCYFHATMEFLAEDYGIIKRQFRIFNEGKQ